jgi:AcrR family transcriptional regulator
MSEQNNSEEASFTRDVKHAFRAYVVDKQREPCSIGSFARGVEIDEQKLYEHFGSLSRLKQSILDDIFSDVRSILNAEELYEGYSAREQLLAFYFTLFERLKEERSYFLARLRCFPTLSDVQVIGEFFWGARSQVKETLGAILRKGEQGGEIPKRFLLSRLYAQLLWTHFLFLLSYWRFDSSPNFEQTDIAVEKSCHLVMDLLGRGAIDSGVEMLSFLLRPSARNTSSVE